MIGYLTGKVLSADPETALLDVGGVGYEVHVPLSTYYEIEGREPADAPVSLHIHTHVREDALALFGFWTRREKAIFERLIGIGGIGPRLARVILSGMAPDELLSAIAAGDAKRLATIPGVGKKTAERMVLELRDKVGELAPEGDVAPAPEPVDDQLVSALVNLGYKASAAERAVAACRRDHPDAGFTELLRVALKSLSRA